MARQAPYVLLSNLRAAMTTDTVDTDFNIRVRNLEKAASRTVDLKTHRRFDRFVATRYYNAQSTEDSGDVLDGTQLFLRYPLQSLTQLTHEGGTVFDPANLQLFPYDDDAPYYGMIEATNSTYFRWVQTPIKGIAVTGIWGYGGQWIRTGATLAGLLDAGETDAPVSDATGFELGCLLRLDDEYAIVTEDVTASPLTLLRAANGTLAVDHADGTPIDVFVPDPLLQRIVTRLVLWMSEVDDTPVFGQINIGDGSQTVDLSAAPSDVQADIALLTEVKTNFGSV